MPGRDDASVPEEEPWVSWVNNIRIGNRVDLIKPNYFRVASKANFIPPANDIQVPYLNVIPNHQLLHTHNHIQMADPHIIFNRAFFCIDYAKSYANAFPDAIAE